MQVAVVTGDGGESVQVGRDYKPTIISGDRWVLFEKVPQREVDAAVQTFVAPSGYRRAWELLWGNDNPQPIVIVCGDIGTGRRSAAMHLLSRGGVAEVYEVQPDWESPRADLIPQKARHNLLLDLTDSRSELNERFGQALKSLGTNLHGIDGRLIITVTPDKWIACREATAAFTVEMGIPQDRAQVLWRHLQHDAGDLPLREPINGIPERLMTIVTGLNKNDEPPRRVVDLVRAIRNQSSLDQEALTKIEQEFHHWKGYLDDQFKRRDTKEGAETSRYILAWRRALLITAAVFNGAPSEVVFDAAYALLSTIGAQPKSDELITGPELSELLADIDGRYKGGNISITDGRPGLDRAVLDRVWEQRPGLQKLVLNWMSSVTADNAPAAGRQDRVAEILTVLAVSQRSTKVLNVVQPWISGNARQRKLAVEMLEQLSVSPDIGAAIRQRLYDWAVKGGLDGHHRIVAEVCGGRLGETHLAVALVRLRYLAKSKDTEVRKATAQAVRNLATSHERTMHILDQALDWAESPETQEPATFILMELMRPVDQDSAVSGILASARDDDRLRQQLQDVWRSLLSNPTTRKDAIKLSKVWQDSADAGILDQDTVGAVLAPALKHNIYEYGVPEAITGGTSPTRNLLVTLVFGVPQQHDEPSNPQPVSETADVR